ncbi:MAG: hypothetical protein R2786_08760 [Flavobacteriaceae bacterium]
MKKIIFLFTLITFFSCSKETEITPESYNNLKPSITSENGRRSGEIGQGTTVTDLIAGQHTVAGTVELWTDGTQLFITYLTTPEWTIDETHLYIGSCEERPANNPGNPLIGQFPYSGNHPVNTWSVTYAFDLASLEPSGCIAAHAKVDGVNGGSETAWGDGEPYGGNSWAMYFYYDLSSL